MLLDPAADRTQGFKLDWIRYWQDRSGSDLSRMNKYLLVDPASSRKKESDFTAMGVIGLGDDNNYYLLDGIRDRLGLTERGDALFALHRRWRPQAVGYERYGMMADVEHFKDRMQRENYRFEITELAGQMAKPDRIRRLIPIFESGRFHLPEVLHKVNYEGIQRDLVHDFIYEEYLDFPVALHDDFFDMLSRIVDPELNAIWPKPVVAEDRYAKPRARVRPKSFMAA
jgi:phage terminase large subunit-like protein